MSDARFKEENYIFNIGKYTKICDYPLKQVSIVPFLHALL